jgi:hypothetical protein
MILFFSKKGETSLAAGGATGNLNSSKAMQVNCRDVHTKPYHPAREREI